ncbi:TonB-dependent receptor domain-containing protein [Emticicia sp. C21]|uniref:TonB-dependent receptor n=1 Tax=Emticicia sp. C21 TaxID=2302915 RepID=UPI001E396947|nr:TonB-dependent receptor [Emticicia sp. C21]
MMQKSTFLRGVFTLLVGIFFAFQGYGQVTSSSITGTVTDSKGEALPGATVVAVHEPSGTKYGTVTNISGLYTLPSVRIGGPYKVTFTFVGYKDIVKDGIIASLGTAANVDAILSEEGTALQEVTISSARSDVFSSNRTGAATNINGTQLRSLPTISRSINDFTRLTPQSNGTSFAGRDNRFNNITIDGANFNNNFGVSDANLPGGSAQPISLDAIEEVQVNIAPYDVRQANFTGAGINVVTKSGTNQFKGSLYTYYRDQSFNGTRVGDTELPAAAKTTNNIYGGTIGGAIIKNKLFFFVSGEYEKNVRPGFNWIASRPGLTGTNVSRTTAEDLERVSTFLKNTYGYETGPYEGYGDNFTLQNYKITARLDWNISNNHKFNIRYSTVNNTDDQLINGTSAPNPRSTSNRVSQNSLTYANSNYGFLNKVNSLAAELNSTFSSKLSNQLLATYTLVQDTRTSKSSLFPFVDIKKDNDSYISFGYELFSYNNDVKNPTLNIIDNLTYYAGKHTILGGIAYENMYFGNSFLRYGTSYYRYNSVDDFINGATPAAYALTYSLLPNGKMPISDLTFGQGSAYLQDEFAVNNKLKLTAGVRVDMPFYPVAPVENPSISKLTFLNGEKINTGLWPKSKPAFSPRVGFNWSDKGWQVRGGTGIFNGRLPFVWFTNQPTNSGMVQFTYETVNATDLAKFPFSKDPAAHLDKLPKVAGQSAPSSIAAVSPDFKMPQVWRTNLAVDKKIIGDIDFTVEAIYSKDLVTVYQRNVNLNNPIGNLTGPDKRPLYSSSTRRVNTAITEAMVLDNTKNGGGWTITAEAKKRYRNFFGSIAYAFNNVKDLTGNPGSQAASAWSNNRAVGSLNDLPLAFSEFAVPHRIVGSASYRFEYTKFLATTVSLFYQGSHQGRVSYVYNGDLNADGINGADLLYVPANESEIIFEDVVASGAVKYTAQQQATAFFNLVNNDKYLSSIKGEYVERNKGLMPWVNRFDFRLLQDFFINVKGQRNTLQLSVDVLNIGNLLNSSWGNRYRQVVNNGAILRYTKLNASGQPMFQMVEVNGKLPTETFELNPVATNTWGAQIGLRYIFN